MSIDTAMLRINDAAQARVPIARNAPETPVTSELRLIVRALADIHDRLRELALRGTGDGADTTWGVYETGVAERRMVSQRRERDRRSAD